MVTFEPKKVDLHPDIVTLKKVSHFLKTDEKIAKLLEVVLHIGNFLNAGNSRLGLAYGFSLDTLAKLQDTKTTDNKSNVFEVIVEMIKDSKSEFLKFQKPEMELLEAGSRVSLQTIDSELRKLRKEFDAASALAPTITEDGVDDQFQTRWNSFAEKAQTDLVELEGDFKESNTEYETAVTLFAEDPKTMGPEEFFQIWKGFIGKVVEVSEKIDAEREKAEKLKKREEAKKKREEQLASPKEADPSGGASGQEEDESGRGRGGGGGARGGPVRGRGGMQRGRGRGGGPEDKAAVDALFAKMQAGVKQ